jgi:aspartokinase
VAARLFDCLSKENINLEMITQGASELNVTAVIAESGVGKFKTSFRLDL